MHSDFRRGWPRLPSTLFALAAVGLTACQREAPTAPTRPRAVVVAIQADQAVSRWQYPARIDSRFANDMAFRVAGKLLDRQAHLGDHVRAGQVLARLDPADAAAQLDAARAALAAADHRLTFARQQIERDLAQAQLKLIARAQLEQSQDNMAAASAGREQAASQLRQAQDALNYQVLRADHDGIISAEYADTGAVLAAGQPVYRLAWDGDRDAVIDVPAADVATLQIGQQAQVRLPGMADQVLTARLREKAQVEDAQSGSFRVKLTLVQPAGGLPLGLTGIVSVARPQPGGTSLSIPASALFHQGNQPAVWVVAPGNNSLSLRPVRVQGYEAEHVRIAGGLAPGERIVAAGVNNVYAGERIQPIAPIGAEGTAS
ncbi:efflux RND transporter periplasmic adaptor subunit [Paludibacterium purpuratum]|uniref:RND family efflux transporter MFP subunit n=1 Tax=Paludibacterium purpuratum TaxID=1144873 RepID=A0A4V3DUW0_9NEIS|nr:efflux RND transporter periplasmic adaptor subunit [Paludibacterium purpuratum]TDR77847.1 RND family efflux transporter MFP subunit [Paludibacterium purpuratum]